MFKPLLVPTDASPLSQDAVARAVTFAREAGARVTFFHAEPQAPSAYLGLGAISNPHLTQELHARLGALSFHSSHRPAHEPGVKPWRVAPGSGADPAPASAPESYDRLHQLS
ncbi:MAG: hypothetical protein RJA36_2630 [Pseudomonadota bacterium]|jgi:nucleotide-binding universal stress UspA family protein